MQNTLEQIKLLNLTDDDFKLLVDGLDALPNTGLAGEMMGDILASMLIKDDDPAKKKVLLEREEAKRKKKAQQDIMIENIKILQGKLLMLKRYMQENKLLADTYDIINIPR